MCTPGDASESRRRMPDVVRHRVAIVNRRSATLGESVTPRGAVTEIVGDGDPLDLEGLARPVPMAAAYGIMRQAARPAHQNRRGKEAAG
jgi:hypothetical protein